MEGITALTVGGVAELEGLVETVCNAVSSVHTARAYSRALRAFLAWYAEKPCGFCRATVQAYRAHLEADGARPATVNQSLSAIRKLAEEARANGWLDDSVARGIIELRGLRQLGVRQGNWLTKAQTVKLLDAPDAESLKGKRDRVVLGLLVGAGLRRDEAARVTVEQIQEREGRPVILDMAGKGKRIRTVPVPRWLAEDIGVWREAAAIAEGFLLRAVDKTGRMAGNSDGHHLSSSGLWRIVKQYAREVGKPELAPHDLRRTFSKLAEKGGAGLRQIQKALGHSSIQTTEKYLGDGLDLENAACDCLGVK